MRFRSTFKYATSDFTGISKSSSIKKARLQLAFSKALGLGNAGKVLSLVFELLLKKRKLTMTFKAIRDKQPGYMSEVFKFNHSNMYQLRSNDCKLYLKKPSTEFMKESFSYREASASNDLPTMSSKFNGCNQLSTRSFETLINNYSNALG